MSFRARLAMQCLLVVLGFVLTGCAALRTSERSISALTYPAQVESLMGDQFAEQIAQEYPVIHDAEADAWLQAMGQRLVDFSPATAQDFTFQFVESGEVNAFAIPGGYCYVNIGLILFAENEAQVAAVVGHEINHVTKRHGILQLQRSRGIQVATDFLASQVQANAAQQAARAAAQAGGYLAMRKFGREDEHEADTYGVQAMTGAGWDPREGIKFFERLNALYGGQTPGFLEQMLATHPATTARIERLQEMTAELDLSGRDLIVNTPEFQAIQARFRKNYPHLQPDASASG
ncbi:MAG: hypothetical protein PWP23_2509 [Candidatus Sumerlaeota bacterium]|nr:hypothetical protein [Candidatus Sumerlaeota bacterium]